MKKEIINNSHDKFFKESFRRKEIAESFIKEYLPKKIRNQFKIKHTGNNKRFIHRQGVE